MQYCYYLFNQITYGGNINKKNVRDEKVGMLAPIPLKSNKKHYFKLQTNKHNFKITPLGLICHRLGSHMFASQI